MGVPGAAQGARRGRRPRPRRGVRDDGRPDDLAGRRAGRLRGRGAGDAPSGHRPHPGQGGRAPAQARLGGLRDVEFAVQLLQLVHGRADESVRVPTTLSALGAADRARLRRARGRRRDAPRLRLPALGRAPAPALRSASHPPHPRRRGGPAPAGPVDGLRQDAGRGAATGAGRRAARRTPSAREALLPTAAGHGGPDAEPGHPAQPGGGGRRGSPRWATPTRRRRCATWSR